MDYHESNVGQFIGRYCSRWIWDKNEIEDIKNFLPFFDMISLILPPHVFATVVESDPVLAQPLVEQGLLVNRDPADALSEGWGDILTTALRESFDLMTRADIHFRRPVSLGDFHLGLDGEEREKLLRSLHDRGVISKVVGGRFFLSHEASFAILHTCASIMCVADGFRGIDSAPFTTEHHAFKYNRGWWPDIYSRPATWVSAVLSTDIGAVGFDLSKLTLDEVLAIRTEHGPEYRSYLRKLRESARALDMAIPEERSRVLADHEIELLDTLADLKRRTRLDRWRRTISVGLGTAGGSWAATSGNPIGGAIAIAAALVGATPSPKNINAYSYLFTVAEQER